MPNDNNWNANAKYVLDSIARLNENDQTREHDIKDINKKLTRILTIGTCVLIGIELFFKVMPYIAKH